MSAKLAYMGTTIIIKSRKDLQNLKAASTNVSNYFNDLVVRAHVQAFDTANVASTECTHRYCHIRYVLILYVVFIDMVSVLVQAFDTAGAGTVAFDYSQFIYAAASCL